MMDAEPAPASSSPEKASVHDDVHAEPEVSASPTPATPTAANAPKTAAASTVEPRKVVRRRKKKDKDGPKHPLTGYIRFMNDRREELRSQQPDATTIEITKLIGAEWNALSDERKQPYLAAAKLAFKRYNLECIDYKKRLSAQGATESDGDISTPKKEPKIKEPKMTPTAASPATTTTPVGVPLATDTQSAPTPTPPGSTPSSTIDTKPIIIPNVAANHNDCATAHPVTATAAATPAPPPLPTQMSSHPSPVQLKLEPPQRTGNYDIPIFTDEFLDHNKLVDVELRTLRKSNTDYEQQNAVLERHVENMRTGVGKLQADAAELQHANAALAAYLEALRVKLACSALAQLSTPTHGGGATLANVDEYMAGLLAMTTTTTAAAQPAAGNANVLSKAREVLRKLDV